MTGLERLCWKYGRIEVIRQDGTREIWVMDKKNSKISIQKYSK